MPTRGFVRGVTIGAELVLAFIVVGGAAVRMVSLPLYTPDSGDEWGNTIAPFRVLFERGDPGTFFHPSLFYYLTAAVFAAVFALAKLIGVVDNSVSMTDLFFLDERVFVFAARAVSVACALLAMWALYALTKSLWGRTAGLAAAALLAVFPLHVLYSETVRVDSLFVLVFIYAFSQIVQILKRSDRRTYATAGVWTGLATGANYNGAVLALWLTAAHVTRRREIASTVSTRTLGLALCLMVVSFVVSSPFVFLNLETFAQNFGFISGLSMSVHPGWEERSGALFYLEDLTRTHPVLAVTIGLSSIAILLFGTRLERFVLSLPVGYAIIFSLFPSKDERFILPAIVMFLLVAAGLPLVASRPWRSRWVRLTGSSLSWALLFGSIGAMASSSLFRVPGATHHILTRPDRVLFDWIEAHVLPRSTILVESGIVQVIDTMNEPGHFAAALRKSVITVRPQLNHEFIGAVYIGGRNYSPALVENSSIDYAIISPRNVAYIETRCDMFPEVCAFYRALQARADVVFETPNHVEPVVIYRLRH